MSYFYLQDTSEISYLPPWSKGISTILEKKISALNVSGEVSQSDETDFVPDHGQAPIDDCSVMEDFSSVMEDTSIIDEHRRYLLVQERSLDDDLMKETGDRVEQNLNRLKEDYQRVDKQNADKKKSEEEERQRKLKQIQEAERLEEIRKCVVYTYRFCPKLVVRVNIESHYLLSVHTMRLVVFGPRLTCV